MHSEPKPNKRRPIINRENRFSPLATATAPSNATTDKTTAVFLVPNLSITTPMKKTVTITGTLCTAQFIQKSHFTLSRQPFCLLAPSLPFLHSYSHITSQFRSCPCGRVPLYVIQQASVQNEKLGSFSPFNDPLGSTLPVSVIELASYPYQPSWRQWNRSHSNKGNKG